MNEDTLKKVLKVPENRHCKKNKRALREEDFLQCSVKLRST